MNPHLTSAQLHDAYFSPGLAAAHLDACPQCRAELARLAESLALFRTAAVAWSEAQPPALFPSNSGAGATRRPFLLPAFALLVAAAALLLSVSVPLRRARSTAAHVQTHSAPATQLTRDNQLLAQIDSDLAATAPAPMQPLQGSFDVFDATATSTHP